MKVKSNKMSDLELSGLRKRVFLLVFSFCLFTFSFSLLPVPSFAQEEENPDAPPPPIKIISKEEQTQLDLKNDPKDRTKLSLDLMTSRLTSAEKLSAVRDFDSMYRELGHFHALMDDAVDYLNKRDDGKGRVLDAFKRLGIALRGMAPKIEVIRRELPIKFDTYVRKLLGFLRLNREKATDSLFVDSVVRKPNQPL